MKITKPVVNVAKPPPGDKEKPGKDFILTD